jgi:uncharacterized protein (TIGR03084 family)
VPSADEAVRALADEQAALSGLLGGLGPDDWLRPSRCEGWSVADVVLHLAQTDELAIGSATGEYEAVLGRLTAGLAVAGSVDDSVAAMVARERGAPAAALFDRWSATAARLLATFGAGDMSARVRWVAGVLSLRTLAATRLSETWIHSGDIAEAVGVVQPPTERLRWIARLAWRTLPYAFTSARRELHGPVAFRLTAPDGTAWDFVPEEPPTTSITGPAADLCAVAARRVPADATALRGEGPDTEAVLSLVRTYA